MTPILSHLNKKYLLLRFNLGGVKEIKTVNYCLCSVVKTIAIIRLAGLFNPVWFHINRLDSAAKHPHRPLITFIAGRRKLEQE